jgi:phosphoglycerate dehydrogenase-like enzyme
MDTQNIVVTFHTSPEPKALFREVLGSAAPLTFLDEIAQSQRNEILERAQILLAWNFPREISPRDYPQLQQVRFIQLLSAGADHMPFADLPAHMLVASNPGAYATPMAEHVLAMTLALAKHLLVQQQKLRHGEFDQFTPNRLLIGITAGILGFGGIGRATARLMRAFGMRIYRVGPESPRSLAGG